MVMPDDGTSPVVPIANVIAANKQGWQRAVACVAWAAMPGSRRGYGRGYSTFNYHVTGGHEAEAREAELRKKPSRLGMLILRLLGYRGKGAPSEDGPSNDPG
jgi:hypothetical protein